ncbi:MAG: hypothetical protein E2O78_08765 [Caldithrix sp.]|nr:MAG: hypothetical protein E2O78_08765 [Caldithrix sp.]
MSVRSGRGHFSQSLACFFLLFFSLCTQSSLYSAEKSSWQRAIQSRARSFDGQSFVGVHVIADVLNINIYYSNKVRKAVLYLGKTKATVTAFNPFVLLGRQVLQMPVATRYSNGDIFVPVKFFLPILAYALGETSGSSGSSIDIASAANIFGVRVEQKANGTLVRVSTSRKFADSALSIRFSREWLYLDILGGKIQPGAFASTIEPGLVKRVEPVQSKEMVQLSFQLSHEVSVRDVQVTQQTNEIWLSIPAKEAINTDLLKKLKDDQEKWKIDRIIIDPGHGGKDPGTIGKRGTYEKDVVLKVAKKLKKLLEKNLNVKVLMTRDSDKYVSLKERTQFANKNKGKLFISIHANWNRNSRVSGAATYFLGLAKSDEALEIAQRENEVIKYDDNQSDYSRLTDEQIILATMAQNAYNKESQDFASYVQKELNKQTGLRNRGVKQAGFYVLVGASMPNVLVETAFMSNKKEEKLLKQSSFQDKIARAIYRSVKQFKEKYEWRVQTSASGL